MNVFWSRIAEFWCTLMHPEPMWPHRGYYRCRVCLREYRVPWECVEPGRRSPGQAIAAKQLASRLTRDQNYH